MSRRVGGRWRRRRQRRRRLAPCAAIGPLGAEMRKAGPAALGAARTRTAIDARPTAVADLAAISPARRVAIRRRTSAAVARCAAYPVDTRAAATEPGSCAIAAIQD